MTSVGILKASDLPAHVRKRYGIDGPRKRPSRAGIGDAAPCPGTCGCGESFKSAPAWQRHSDALGAGHRRWTITLEVNSDGR